MTDIPLFVYTESGIKKRKGTYMDDYNKAVYNRLKCYFDSIGLYYHSYDSDGRIRFKSEGNFFTIITQSTKYIVLVHFGKAESCGEDIFKKLNEVNFTLTMGTFMLSKEGDLFLRYTVSFEDGNISETFIAKSILISEALVKENADFLMSSEEDVSFPRFNKRNSKFAS